MKYGYSKELRSSVHPLPPSSTRLCNLCRAGFLGALTIQWTSVHGLGTFGRCHYPAFKYTFVNSVSFFDEPSHAVRDSMELLDPLHEYTLSCRTYTEYVYKYIYIRIIIFLYEDLYIKCTYIHILYMYNVQASLTVVTEMKFEAILRVRLYASTVLGWCVNDVKCTLPDFLR
jgi:hypothetical protein